MAGNTGVREALGDLMARAAGGDETTVLTGRTLRAVRGIVLAVIGAAVLVYSVDLFALWDESNALEFKGEPDEYGERTIYNYFGLTIHERGLLGDSGVTPGWYPIFVVTRQVILDVVAVGIAWLIYSRRPRHWMAYLSILFIVLVPWFPHAIRDLSRLGEDNTIETLARFMGIIAMVVLFAFLWLFPDGRFRGALLRLVGGLIGLIIALIAIGQVGKLILDDHTTDTVADVLTTIGFLSLAAGMLFWAIGGIAVQIWRYRHTPLADRRLARWNLAFIAAVPLWILPFDALHDFFGEEDEASDDLFGFAWEQIHETLYLVAPVLMGIWILVLVRRQGWWDFQTLWNRTAVYGIGLALLGGMYVAALGLVTVVASPLAATGEQVVAVLVATAIVVFSYGPVLGRVRRWVDERWFPKRAELESLSQAFAEELRATASPAAVPDRLRAAVQTSLDPEHVELWTISGGDQR